MLNKVFTVIIILGCFSQVLGVTFDGRKTRWNGFERYEFQVEGRDCFLVVPERELPSRPWVWRARFPDWHTEVDMMLLKKGYHIAYMDVVDLYGGDLAVYYWDKFYDYMIAKGMSPKVVLVAVSRGGLICYNWAKKNAKKVACMYLESPVCDIKSWPGGKGKGKGSEEDWEKLKKVYSMNEEQLMVYDRNPINGLELLAEAKVPILHSIGLNDKIVPPEENTFVIMRKYILLGGPFAVYPQTQGEQQLEGHHFPIDDPNYIVNFIIVNSIDNCK